MSKKVVVMSETYFPDCCKNVLQEISCIFYAKMAFMLEMQKYQVGGKNLLLSLIEKNHILEGAESHCGFLKDGSYQSFSLSADELEQLYERTIGSKLRKGQSLPLASSSLYLEPVKYNNQLVSVDSMGYFVYGIMQNNRCLNQLEEYVKGKEKELYKEYRESEYFYQPILNMFLQNKKRLSGFLIGLICKARKDLQHQCYYNDLMKIVYAGYRNYKNQLKRFQQITGADVCPILSDESNFVENCAKTSLFFLIANDLQVSIVPDYFLYMGIIALKVQATYFTHQTTAEQISEVGKVYKKKIKAAGYDLQSYYDNHYSFGKGDENIENAWREKLFYTPKEKLEPEEAAQVENMTDEDYRDVVEKIFEQHQLNLRAFEHVVLDESEAEYLCEILKECDVEEYENHLLISILCKYINELHALCAVQGEEEWNYQLDDAQDKLGRIKERQKEWENEKNQIQEEMHKVSEALLHVTRENEKLQEQVEKLLEERAQEKRELVALRNYVYQEEQNLFESETDASIVEKSSRLKQAKVVVVGGHPNWQGKISQLFPNASYIAAENLNFDLAIVKNADYIIFNTGILKHACYYRVMSQKESNAQILYVSNNNVERCMQELCAQM